MPSAAFDRWECDVGSDDPMQRDSSAIWKLVTKLHELITLYINRSPRILTRRLMFRPRMTISAWKR